MAYQLINGHDIKPGQRVSGMYAIWKDAHYPNWDPKPADKIRVCCARVTKKIGDKVKVDKHWREMSLGLVFLLDGNAPVVEHWPRHDYEWGGFVDLTIEQAKTVLDAIGVTNHTTKKEEA